MPFQGNTSRLGTTINYQFQGLKMENNMKIINLSVVMAAACFVATTAFAANMSASGVIKSVDSKNDAITLVDGGVYTLTEGFEAETFKVGEKVKIVFETKNGKMMASSVKAVH